MAVAGADERPGEREMLQVAESCEVGRRRARAIVAEVKDAVRRWPRFAAATGVPAATIRRIGAVIAAR
jgi:serine/threonine-protein kinase HipA